ncbi:MAG: glycosyltransferase family 2 protein, partial [Dehalococcoidia bacterium]|nr:glycosyltransferase family 2 protein [Dehalococcoidia bacterium]
MAETLEQVLPTVSVVVLNYNGKHHLKSCFPSLMQLRYPKDKLELIMVDNGSKDGSLEFMKESFPAVVIVRNPENYGFAKGNNIGARAAHGEYVAFLNNDCRVDPDWVGELLGPVLRDHSVVCTASKMLSWDGQRVDFVGSKMNFYGCGFHLDFGAPYVDGLYGEEKRVPSACGGAMLIDRKVFLDCGGFDEDYFAYFEDLDLGWRLWVLGYSVVFAPKAIAYHKHHGTSGIIPEHRLRVIFQRNSLYTIFKNYEQENLQKVLPLALLLLAKWGLHDIQIDVGEFSRPDGAKGDTMNSVPKLGLACLLAMDEFASNLPRLQEKRQWVQEHRRRSDSEIFRIFGRWIETPVLHTPSFLATQDTLVRNLEVPEFLHQRRRSILLITHDVISENMAGPGMRYWEIARVLSKEFAVTLAAPGQPRLSSPDFEVRGYRRSEADSLTPLVREADVVFAFAFVLHEFPILQNLEQPLIVDIYDPFTLEHLEIFS